MSTITPTQPIESPNLSEWIPFPLYRMTLEQYEEMVKTGAFSDRDPVHLINGYLAQKMTQHDPHSTADELCGRALEKALPPGWHVRSAKPLRLPPDSKPEPDRSVVRGQIRDYSERSPGPSDTGLVVEIAVSSLAQDRMQSRIYAAAGIPVYWIVNVVARRVEVYSEPGTDGYQVRTAYTVGQSVPLILDGVQVGSVAVDDVLP
jgi:Uma2 family endonuclease